MAPLLLSSLCFLLSFTLCVCSLATGENVEENAYVVLRLLIRRPECFGPALRGDGGNGLLAAIEEGIKISEDPSMDGPCTTYNSNRVLLVLDADVFHLKVVL